MPPDRSLLTPQDRESLAQLQLLARTAVAGIYGGRHPSPRKGTSTEFKEHRPYVRGDELRSIDWKLFGKTDRLYIRQQEDERSMRGLLLLDQSGSMQYGGKRAAGITKHDYAVRLAACLATLLIVQRDAVGLATFDAELREFIPPRSLNSHLRVLLTALVRSTTATETSIHRGLEQAAARCAGRGVLILISDLFDDDRKWLDGLRLFRRSGNEVIVFQVWDRDELDFPFHQRVDFRSLEFPERQYVVSSRAVRRDYLERVRQFRQRLTQDFAEADIDLCVCTTDEPYTAVLARYLDLRHRGSQGQAAARQPIRAGHSPDTPP